MTFRRWVGRPLSALAGPVAAITLLVGLAITIALVTPTRDETAASPAPGSATPFVSTTTRTAASPPRTQGPTAASSPVVAVTPSPSPSPTPGASSTADATATAAPPADATGTPYLASCAIRGLDFRIDGWTVTAAATVISVTIENPASEACAVHWRYPVAMLDGDGNELAASQQIPRDEPVRQLRAGEAATGVVEWSSSCAPSSTPAAFTVGLPGGRDGDAVTIGVPARLPEPRCSATGSAAITPWVVREAYRGMLGYDSPDDVSLSEDGRTLTLMISGNPPFRDGDPCSSDYAASVLAHGDELEVGLFPVTYGRPEPPFDGSCPDQAYFAGYRLKLDVGLAAPFTGSTVRTGQLGAQAFLVRPPDRLLRLTALPKGWELRIEGDPADDWPEIGSEGDYPGANVWFQVYSPLATPPDPGDYHGNPRHSVGLVQAFDAPMQPTGEDARPVDVNGNPGVLYHLPAQPHDEFWLGTLTLIWRVGNDEVTLNASDADFSAEELVRLAESAVSRDPAPTHAPATDSLRGSCLSDSEECRVDPGTYTPNRTTPRMRFTVGRGWHVIDHEAATLRLGAVDLPGVYLSMARDATAGHDRPIEPGPQASATTSRRSKGCASTMSGGRRSVAHPGSRSTWSGSDRRTSTASGTISFPSPRARELDSSQLTSAAQRSCSAIPARPRRSSRQRSRWRNR